MTALELANPIDDVVARAEALMNSGMIRATAGRLVPKREGISRNRGKGLAFDWLCKHVTYNEKKCLFWPFSKNGGYPAAVGYRGKIYKPTRLMCMLAHGVPPSSRHHASYTCDRGDRGCINPTHLAWKTNSEARRFQAKNGRINYGRRGKITPAQAAEIREIGDSKSRAEVAKLYGLSAQRVSNILHGDGFTRPRRPWHESGGRFYPRISSHYRCYSLGGYGTSAQAEAAYASSLDRLMRGEPAKLEAREKGNPADIRRLYAKPMVAFETEGERVIAIEPEQDQSVFLTHNALNGLHPQVKKFVVVASNTGDLTEAATAAGLSEAQVAMVLPRLRIFLGPMLR